MEKIDCMYFEVVCHMDSNNWANFVACTPDLPHVRGREFYNDWDREGTGTLFIERFLHMIG